MLYENVIIQERQWGFGDLDREMSVASHRRIRAPSKSTKRLTLQSLREFAVAWSTTGYAFAFHPRSFSPLSSHPFYPVTVDDSGKRHPVPRPSPRWQRVWISSALFHPRRTYFNDSRRRERFDWCFGTIPNTPRGGSIARSLRLRFHHFRGENARLPKDGKGRRKGLDGGEVRFISCNSAFSLKLIHGLGSRARFKLLFTNVNDPEEESGFFIITHLFKII